MHILRENAHRVYFKGLLETGINLDRIPRIDEMNDILGRIGWGAVAVDGFIPPSAFMEFQAYRVLVIACDMRQIDHIEYTPAPDIVHEAAGHAPIIVDLEYAGYLRRFGEVGARAIMSRKDLALYEAIRRLSILKEMRDPDPKAVSEAETEVLSRQTNLGEPSEMARLSRLHWWTVEYGLIGELRNPKIYGAGLLSSIGEAVTCLDAGVSKLPYSLEAADYPFDITTRQPQLFVTPDFDHLQQVLSQFVDTMAVSVGGKVGLERAIESGGVCTAVYSSGLQVSGVMSEYLRNGNEWPVYLIFKGPTALAVHGRELSGQGKDYHPHGFSSPIGKLRGHNTPIELMTDSELRVVGMVAGEKVRLEFDGGIEVLGRLERLIRSDGRLVLATFSECTVRRDAVVLFQPSFGLYDMAIGEKIVSVFGGAADKDAFEQVAPVSRQRTVKTRHDAQARNLHELYRRIRNIRDGAAPLSDLGAIWK
ncbi:aromatic amino acid hydroxylase, partial [candidate division GN15 bacterium]